MYITKQARVPLTLDLSRGGPMSAREVTLPQIHRTEVDGVAVFWSPAPGPLTCGLMFRVGRADETLPTAGITHMVEHLTMAPFGPHDDDSNAFVDETRTVFHSAEGERDVAAFLGGVTAALVEPDVTRLEMERGILLDEARSRSPAVDSELRRLRFGPTGHGLAAVPELGLNTVTPEAVIDWARSRFTAANAALVLSRPVPAGLSLTLASGARHGAVQPIPVDRLQLPAVAHLPVDGVAIGFVARRRAAVTVAVEIIERRVRRQVRHERGLAYEIGTAFDALSPRDAHVSLYAACPDDRFVTVNDTVLIELRQLASEGPTDAEVRSSKDGYRRHLTSPEACLWLADFMARESLWDGVALSPEGLMDEREAVDTLAVAEATRELLASAIAFVPSEDLLDREGWEQYPEWSDHQVSGRVFRPGVLAGYLGGMRRQRLIVGEEGVTAVANAARGHVQTVRYADCVGLEVAAEGRMVWGRDGTVVPVGEPVWRGGAEAVRMVDAAIPRSLRFTEWDRGDPGK